MPRMTGGVKTGRYYIRLPEETIAEIDGYIKESGMYQSYFLSNALIVGARIMARQLNPERFYTPEMVEAMLANTETGKVLFAADGCWLTRQIRERRPPHVLTNLLADDPRAVRSTIHNLHAFSKACPDVAIIPTHCPEAFAREMGAQA